MNPEHANKLKEGVQAWNAWRLENPTVAVDLSGAELSNMDLTGVDLRHANLEGANLYKADLSNAKLDYAVFSSHYNRGILRDATLEGASMDHVDLWEANLIGAKMSKVVATNSRFLFSDATNVDLRGAQLTDSDLGGINLAGGNLAGANLERSYMERCNLVGSGLEGASFAECCLYGASVWDVRVDQATNSTGVIVSRHPRPAYWDDDKQPGTPKPDRKQLEADEKITVDDLQLAQFMFLILNNDKVRNVLDSATSKIVLILGRFGAGGLDRLQALRSKLQKLDYVPILFDFEPSPERDFTETVALLASLSKGVIADLTNPSSIPQELGRIVPNHPSLPVVPILQGQADGQNKAYAMFEDLARYPWVQDMVFYADDEDLIENKLETQVMRPLDNFVKRRGLADVLRQLSRGVYQSGDQDLVDSVVGQIDTLRKKLDPKG